MQSRVVLVTLWPDDTRIMESAVWPVISAHTKASARFKVTNKDVTNRAAGRARARVATRSTQIAVPSLSIMHWPLLRAECAGRERVNMCTHEQSNLAARPRNENGYGQSCAQLQLIFINVTWPQWRPPSQQTGWAREAALGPGRRKKHLRVECRDYRRGTDPRLITERHSCREWVGWHCALRDACAGGHR